MLDVVPARERTLTDRILSDRDDTDPDVIHWRAQLDQITIWPLRSAWQ
jgi:hypothetical protein